MPQPSEYLTYLLELLAPLGQVTSRSMFGGYGIYRDGVMFGLVAYDTLYFKVTAATALKHKAPPKKRR